MQDDTPTIGERMTRELGLDPALLNGPSGLIDEIEQEIDETAEASLGIVKPGDKTAADDEG